MNLQRGEFSSDEGADDLHYRGPATIRRLAKIRQELAGWAHRTGIAATDADGVVLACYEAMANVATHAYDGQVGILEVHATADQQAVHVRVVDYGRWQPPPDEPGLLGGRGLLLIRALAAAAEVIPTDVGTTVRMRWELPAGQTPQVPGRPHVADSVRRTPQA